MEDKAYVDTNALMRKYGVSRITIHNWRKQGMPCIKLGYIVRFDMEQVDNWLRNKK